MYGTFLAALLVPRPLMLPLVAWLLIKRPQTRVPVGVLGLVTVGLGVALRIVVQGHEFKPAFTLVAVVFVGAGMLGWRGAVIGVRAVGERRDDRSRGSLRQR